MKRRGRAMKWIAGLTVLGIAALAGTLYVLASGVPGEYRPVSLLAEEKSLKIQGLEDKLLRQFIGPAGAISTYQDDGEVDPNQTFMMTVTHEEINDWIGALPDEAMDWLAGVGLRGPAVALDKGRMTFYAYWVRHKKVVGIDLHPTIRGDGKLVIRIGSVRLGNLAMSQGWIDKEIRRLIDDIREGVERETAGGAETFAGLPAKKFRRVMTALLDAASGIPIEPNIRESWGKVRIREILLVRDKATLVVAPLGPDQTDGANAGGGGRIGER